MYNNAAYDFNAFKEREAERRAKVYELPNRKSRLEKKRVEKLKFFGRCLSLVLGSALTVCVTLFGQAKLVECSSQAEAKSVELEELKIRNKQLEMKLGHANAASKAAGQKSEGFVETVTISSGDKAIIK